MFGLTQRSGENARDSKLPIGSASFLLQRIITLPENSEATKKPAAAALRAWKSQIS